MKRLFTFIMLIVAVVGCGEDIGNQDVVRIFTTTDYWASNSIVISVASEQEDVEFTQYYLIGQSDEGSVFASDGVMDCSAREGGIRFVNGIMSTAPITPKVNGMFTVQICQDDVGAVNDRIFFVNGKGITASTDRAGNDVFHVKLCNPSVECPDGVVLYDASITDTNEFVVALTTASNSVIGVVSAYAKRVTDPLQLLGGVKYLTSWQPITYTVEGQGYLFVGIYDATGNANKIIDCKTDVNNMVYATVNGDTKLLDMCAENRLLLGIDSDGKTKAHGKVRVIFTNKVNDTDDTDGSSDPATDDTVNPGNGTLNLGPTQIAVNFSTQGQDGITVTELRCWNYVNPNPPHDPILGSFDNIITEDQNYVYTNEAQIQCNAKLSNGQWYVEKNGIKLSLAKIKVSLPDLGISFWLDSQDLWIDNSVGGGNLAFKIVCQKTNGSQVFNSCQLLTITDTVVH